MKIFVSTYEIKAYERMGIPSGLEDNGDFSGRFAPVNNGMSTNPEIRDLQIKAEILSKKVNYHIELLRVSEKAVGVKIFGKTIMTVSKTLFKDLKKISQSIHRRLNNIQASERRHENKRSVNREELFQRSKLYGQNTVNEIYLESRVRRACGEHVNVDHIIPLKAVDKDGVWVATGLTVPSNLEIVPVKQNAEKANIINLSLINQQLNLQYQA